MVVIKEQIVQCGQFYREVELEDNAVILDTAYDQEDGHWTILYYIKDKPDRRPDMKVEAKLC